MKKYILLILFSSFTFAQKKSVVNKEILNDSIELEKFIFEKSRVLSSAYHNETSNFDSLAVKIRTSVLLGDFDKTLTFIDKSRKITSAKNWAGNQYVLFEIYSKSKIIEKQKNISFKKALDFVLKQRNKKLSGMLFVSLISSIRSKEMIESYKNNFRKLILENDSLDNKQINGLIEHWSNYKIISQVNGQFKAFVESEHEKRFDVDTLMLKISSGATLNVTLVREKGLNKPMPVVLTNTIYAGDSDEVYCKRAVVNGYVGVVVNTRGKRSSVDKNEPFEHEVEDLYEVIDWISKQSWCNGKIGMIGGSYLGFSQWAATKKLHPALKTIVPQVAVGIGSMDYPMENNVFMSYMYRWICYVTNNKLTDSSFNDNKKWDDIFTNWYKSGKSFRELDSIGGVKKEIFQRWLDHPSFDEYWQSMVPYKDDFSKINIPILTTTGFYDSDQEGAMYYFKEHNKYNKNANHYLVIGPYDHGSGQNRPNIFLRGYKLDEVAQVSMLDLGYEWFDFVLKGKKKPKILKDKFNFQIMGTNKWYHVDSFSKTSNKKMNLFLNKNSKTTSVKPEKVETVQQIIDFKIRDDKEFYYKVGKDSILLNENLNVIESEIINEDILLSGSFKGNFNIEINKKDVDIFVQLFQVKPEGGFFNLGETVFRASYAKDMSKRELLTPNKIENVNVSNTSFIAKKIPKGSKFVVVFGVNKSKEWQINYGTGKDVSDETIEDAKEPLQIKWYNDSFLEIPILKI